MGIEIERKFLVRGRPWQEGTGVWICQGYLSRADDVTVRVRVAGGQGFLTIKGPSQGWSRSEFEYSIPAAEARELLALCGTSVLEKRRYLIGHHDDRWEVDEFLGRHAGLVLAEIELAHESQDFARPAWLGDEVSDDPRYRNSALANDSEPPPSG
jgi:CYTH domain-containing protein